MKKRGIRIVRYADDILIFAREYKEARKYQEIATKILEQDLKLKVNQEKTHLTDNHRGAAFLGFIIREKHISIHPKRLKKFKQKIKELTPRNHGMSLGEMIKRLNPVLRGWVNYFRVANCKKVLERLMEWVRRRLRMKKMKEWKQWKPLHRALRRNGYKGEFKKIAMNKWRNSASPLVSMALPNKWFDEQGLVNMAKYEVGILHHFR